MGILKGNAPPVLASLQTLEGMGDTRCSGPGTCAILDASVLPGSEPVCLSLGHFGVLMSGLRARSASPQSTLGCVCKTSAWGGMKNPGNGSHEGTLSSGGVRAGLSPASVALGAYCLLVPFQ